jgi:hypothetical protein
MQSVGKVLEGGKLAAGDEKKYERMLPQPGDSEEIAAQKIAGMKKMLTETTAARVETFGKTGYDVGGLKGAAIQASDDVPVGTRRRNSKTGETVEYNGESWVKVTP